MTSGVLLSHGGGLNKDGCHNDRKNGGYHCHRSSSSGLQGIPQQKDFKLSEGSINARWCESRRGIAEFRTKDGTYVDCLTDTYAVEAEFDNNWKEAIGQSLHYAESTNKKAAIIELLPEYYPSSIFQRLSKSLDLKNNNIKLKKNYFNGTIMTKKNIKEVSNFIKTN